MLKCKDIAEQSSEFIDDRLSVTQKLRVYFHLLICAHCRCFIQQFKRLISHSKGLQQTHITDEEAEAILQHVKQENK